jgi:hypothetical protein
LVADLAGDPGFGGAAGEGVAQAPEGLGGEQGREAGEQSGQDEGYPYQGGADQDRAAPADGVGHDPGRDLEHQDAQLQRGAEQDQLKRPQMGVADEVDSGSSPDDGLQQRGRALQHQIDNPGVTGSHDGLARV